MAHGLWNALPDELVARIVDGAPAASLPALLRLERRACRVVARARLAQLREVWRAQETGHINDQYENFTPSDVLGVVTQKSLEVVVHNATSSGMEALKSGIDSGGFAAIKSLSFLFSNLPDADLCSLLPAFGRGAMLQLEELRVHGNFAEDSFMVKFSQIVASGGFAQLCLLDLCRNHIGDPGMEAFAKAITNDAALPRLNCLLLLANAQMSANGLHHLTTSLANPQSLPSLAKLDVEKALLSSNLRAVCKARGILHEDEDPLWAKQQYLARRFPGRGFETWQPGS